MTDESLERLKKRQCGKVWDGSIGFPLTRCSILQPPDPFVRRGFSMSSHLINRPTGQQTMCGFVIFFARSLSKTGDTWSVVLLIRCSDDRSPQRSPNTQVSSFCPMSRQPFKASIPNFEALSNISISPADALSASEKDNSGTNGRRLYVFSLHPHVTHIAPCGVFVFFRDAKRFVFRVRTDPKDATPCRQRGEGRARASTIETPTVCQLRPSTAVGGTALQRRSRPFGRKFSCFGPEGPAERYDKPLFQRRKQRFSTAMKKSGISVVDAPSFGNLCPEISVLDRNNVKRI